MPAKTGLKFDPAYWEEIIRRPDWYLEYAKFAKEAKDQLGEQTEELGQLLKQARHFFESALLDNKVKIAASGPNLDAERQPIDTVVIHHTSGEPGYRLSYMNAVQLLNIYASHFANPSKDEEYLKGQPIWSNHLSEGKPVFYVYHWLMRMDGSFERLVRDDQIGWHAGNWEINKRSIAICLDNDYEKRDPTDEILRKLAAFIKINYPQIKPGQVIGHCEARTGTICPGGNWLTTWKPKLLSKF